MKQTIIGITMLGVGAVGGAVLSVDSATYEKVDNGTIKITQGVNVSIQDLKNQLNGLQQRKNFNITNCQSIITKVDAEIADITKTISEASKLGVE